MVSSGLVDKIRKEEGNLKYEYFFPMDEIKKFIRNTIISEIK